MVKNKNQKINKAGDKFDSMNDANQSDNLKDKSLNIEITSDQEDQEDEENNLSVEEKEDEENNAEDDEDEKKEMKEFTIELIIHTSVMDNSEEIKTCICRNHIIFDEKEKEKEENENIYIEKEIIPSIKIPIIRETNNELLNQLNNIESGEKFYIKLNDLVKCLQKIGFPLSGSMVNIYINYINNYIFFGTEPIDNKTILYSYMLEPNKDIIKMKIINYIQKRMLDGYSNSIINTYFRKPIQKKGLPSLELKTKIFTPSMTNLEYYNEWSDDEKSTSSPLPSEYSIDKDDYNDVMPIKNDEKKTKENFSSLTDSRKRERKIGYIIEKVYAWRKLYNGFKDEKNNFIKYSLDNAANEVGVSKKSLDDYLLQIRLGRKYGFNFDENKTQKIGVLREHVKKTKEAEPKTGIVKKRNFKKKKKGIGNKEIKEDEDDKKENKKLSVKKKFEEDLKLRKSNSKVSLKSGSFIGRKRKGK